MSRFCDSLSVSVGRYGQNELVATALNGASECFPLGGYVKMLDEREGEVDPRELHRSFNRQSVWRRMAIVVAGPVANLLLAVLVYWGSSGTVQKN